MKKTQKGFTLVEGLLIILIISVLSFGGWYVLNEKDSSNEADLQSETELTQSTEDEEALKKEKNDYKRKNDLARLASTLEFYAADNSGSYPSTDQETFNSEFIEVYVDDLKSFQDPSTGDDYETRIVKINESAPALNLGTIQYKLYASCSEGSFIEADSKRKYAVRTLLESGDSLCYDNV